MINQDQYWDTIIERYKKSGLSQPVFCRQNEIIYSQFIYRWNKKNQTAEASKTGSANNLDSSTFERMNITSASSSPIQIAKTIELLIHLPNQIRCDVKFALNPIELPEFLTRLGGLC